MKKLTALFFTFLMIGSSIAQEVESQMIDNDEWSDETKQVLLVLFTLLCLFFAARTFRGKPDA